ncbi:MAG: biotin--[acetyl-CoA-carboxylase] ligase, partial [Clostridia bacterium]
EGLTIKIAKCVKKSIYELYNIDLNIKEPNDLLLNNKKICGILTEINTIGEKINYLIISIGFNVNEDNFSTEIKDIAISLKSEFKRDFTREEIIIKFIENLEKELEF